MTPLEQILIEATPGIVDLVKSMFASKNPDAPQPTSEEVIAAYESLFASSVAKDEMIKAANS